MATSYSDYKSGRGNSRANRRNTGKRNTSASFPSSKKPKKTTFGTGNFLDTTLNVLDAPDAVFRASLQGLGEAITGEDLYKEGDFSRIMRGQSGGSWGESLKRIGMDTGAAASGLALDILTSPTTWLTLGASAITKTGKAAKAIRGVGKTQALANLSSGSKAASLAADALKQSKTAIKQAEKIKSLNKVVKYGQRYDLAVGSTMLAKGIGEVLTGDSSEERLKGFLMGGLGMLGVTSTLNDKKTINTLMDFASDPKTFTEKAADYFVTGGISNSLERAVGEKTFKVQVFNDSINDVYSYAPNGVEKVANKVRTDKAFDRALFDFADSGKIDPQFKNYLTPELKSKIDTSRTFSAAELQKRGKATIDDYVSSKLLVEKEGQWVPASAEDLLSIGGDKKSVKSVFDDLRGESVGKKRKFKTADERDIRFEELFRKGEIPHRFRTERSFEKSFTKDMGTTQRMIEKSALSEGLVSRASNKATDSLKGAEDVVRVYDPKEYKSLTDSFRRQKDKAINSLKKLPTNVKKEINSLSNFYTQNVDNLLGDVNLSRGELSDKLGELSDTYTQNLKTLTRNVPGATDKIQSIKDTFNKQVESLVSNINKRASKLHDLGYEFGAQSDIARTGGGLNALAYKPRIATSLKNINTNLEANSVSANIDSFIKNLKLLKVQGDFFQYGQVGRRALSLGRKRFMKYLSLQDPRKQKQLFKEAQESGLIFGRFGDFDVQTFSDNAKDLDKMNTVDAMFVKSMNAIDDNRLLKPLNKIMKWMQKNEHVAFNVLTPNAKMQGFHDLRNKFMKAGASKTEAGAQAGRIINNMFAGQNWEQIMARHPSLSKESIRMLRMLTFAPDYLTSNLNKIVGVGSKSLAGKVNRDELMAATFLGFMMTEALNYASTGHSTFDNVEGNEMSVQIPGLKDEKGNVMGVNIMGNWAEPIKFMDNPFKFTLGKTGIGANALVAAKSDFGIDPKDFLPIPFASQPIAEVALSPLTEGDQSQVPESLSTALGQSAIEMTGSMASFRSGKDRPTSLLSNLKDLK